MSFLRAILFLPEPVASWCDPLDLLHGSILFTALLGCLGIFGYTAYALIRWRTKPPFGTTEKIESATPIKIALVVGMLALFLLWWGLGYHAFVRMQDAPADALDIQVVAKQWMWKFLYADGTTSTNVLVVPQRANVRLLMTSRDVIHSFFVPGLRNKRDVVPGMTSQMWFRADRAGTFPIACAEFCGLDHSRMRASLVVLEPAAWAEWAAHRGPLYASPPDGPQVQLAEQGRRIASQKGCFRCHSVDGSANIGPTWVGVYGSTVALADGRSLVADPTYLTRSMMDPEADVVDGFAPVMPTYRGLLSAEEAGALVAYLEALAGGPDQGEKP